MTSIDFIKKNYIGSKEAARIIAKNNCREIFSLSQVSRLCAKGEIRSILVGNTWVIDKKSCENYTTKKKEKVKKTLILNQMD